MSDTKSYRTRTRQSIQSYLEQQSNRNVSVQEIYQYLQDQQINVNLSTVYRNMEALSEQGIVQKFYGGRGDTAVYQYLQKDRDCRDHLHIQCIQCGQLSHLDCEFETGLVEHLKAHHKFIFLPENSLIYGLCENCSDGK